jgi:hypothetical protein
LLNEAALTGALERPEAEPWLVTKVTSLSVDVIGLCPEC